MSAINLPKYYENEAGIIKRAGDFIKEFGKNVLIVGGETALKIVRIDLYRSLEENSIKYEVKKFNGYPTQKYILDLCNLVEKNNNDAIVGVGGGKVLDLVKAVGDAKDIPIVTIPTVPATCAAWSALSVIYKENGEQDIYINLKNSPSLILADKEILSKVPIRYINSGVADSIVKWYEISPDLKHNANDFCLRLQLKVCELALEFLQKDYINAYKEGNLLSDSSIISNAIDSIIMLAGLSGSIKGSVPYGGLAHPFYNNSTKVYETHWLLHGEKVSFGLLVQLNLEKRTIEEMQEFIEWMHLLDLPITLNDLGIDSKNVGNNVSVIARGIKESVGDYSGLDYELTEDNIIEAIFEVDKISKRILNGEVRKNA